MIDEEAEIYIYACHSARNEYTRLDDVLGSRSEGSDDDDDPWHQHAGFL